MPQKIRLWQITPDEKLSEITEKEIDLERRMGDWLEEDISILGDDLLVIGREVPTDFNSRIDLLCIDSKGDLVVIELKKGKTSREVTAQALDYSSWVRDLSFDQITEIAESYERLGAPSLEEAFQRTFDVDSLPEAINEGHRSMIVAESIDDDTERIVRYLADFNVPVNVLTVQHFLGREGMGLIAQVFLIEPEVAEENARVVSRKSVYFSLDQIQSMSERNGVGNLFSYFRHQASLGLSPKPRSDSRNLALHNRSNHAILVIDARDSNAESGLKFRVNVLRYARHLGVDNARILAVLPNDAKPTDDWRRATEEERPHLRAATFRTEHEIDTFVEGLNDESSKTAASEMSD